MTWCFSYLVRQPVPNAQLLKFFSSRNCSLNVDGNLTYLFREEPEALIFSYAFIGLSQDGVEWFASCSEVGGTIPRDGKRSNENL